MAPDKRSELLRWLPVVIIVASMIVSVALSWQRVDSAQGETMRVVERERMRVDGLEHTVKGIGDSFQKVENVMNEIRFNIRRDMNDRGVRYIDSER